MKDKCYPNSLVTNLTRCVTPEGMKYYIPEPEIKKTHPCESDDPLVHSTYDAAIWLVGERHGKYDLVNLVGHLLLKLANAEERNRLHYRESNSSFRDGVDVGMK